MRSNLSFGCMLAPNNRDRFVPLSCQSPLWGLRACEAISLFSVCWLWKGEIATLRSR